MTASRSAVRVGLLIVVTLLVTPLATQANNECGFARTLDVGVEGEDVRCLQTFLNASGYIIADDGPGSIGNETNRFGSLTEAAVIEWQTPAAECGC